HYLGSDTNAAAQQMIQLFSLVNTVFNPLNVTVVLSSLELWAEDNKIPTAGEAADVLQRFQRWEQSALALHSYDAAYLLVYRDGAAPLGTTALGTACQRDAAAAVALFHRAMALESFSILLAQLLGRSLGMSYDPPGACHCPGHVCLMSPEALRFSGAKALSSCSIRDFGSFLRRAGGSCLFHSPRGSGERQRRAATCGNGLREPPEQCDCGSRERCLKDKCCTETCRLVPGAQCSSGLCCKNCQFRKKYWPCRAAADTQCDVAEFCSGASASCPPDLHVQDGHSCERGTGYCYRGRCQAPDLQCQRLYGTGSKSAPVSCYEELNSQQDRFGHCGLLPSQRYKSCTWRDLRCGKLICTYPSSIPFPSDAAAVVYVRVQEHLCVSLNY
ncbi:ADA32 protein, partial [Urocolius indicus]|nr:ADA32 protein [Urocolius indicus]